MKIKGIQILRGIAANLVLLFHCLVIGLLPKYGYDLKFEPLTLFRNFLAGTDLLICISGFVTCYGYLNKNKSGRDFFLARLIRIVPMYWFFTTFAFTILTIVGPQPEFKLFLQSLLFVVDLNAQSPILAVGWVLQYVIFWYLLFALVLIFFKQRRFLILCIALLATVILQPNHEVLLEFILGGIGYKFYTYRIFTKFRTTIFCSSLFLYVIGIFLFTPSFAENYRVICFGIPASLMIASFASIDPPSNFLQTIGSYSYSLFLIHFPLLSIYFKLISVLGPDVFPAWLLILGAVVSCNTAAYISWRCIEMPVSGYLKRRLDR